MENIFIRYFKGSSDYERTLKCYLGIISNSALNQSILNWHSCVLYEKSRKLEVTQTSDWPKLRYFTLYLLNIFNFQHIFYFLVFNGFEWLHVYNRDDLIYFQNVSLNLKGLNMRAKKKFTSIPLKSFWHNSPPFQSPWLFFQYKMK
jgi:hypothetical protein